MKDLKYVKLNRETLTLDQFRQILEIEQADGEDNGYSKEIVKEIYVTDTKNINFACVDAETNQIVAHIATNPQSKRRNGSVFVINLVVSPNYRRLGIAQNLLLTATKHYAEMETQLPMSISVDKDNLPAINLYKKVGFEIMDPICEADEDGEQYILAAPIEILNKKMENLKNGKTQ